MEEFERTYLAKELPSGFERVPSEEMLDIYIPSSVEHPVLRIRKAGEKYEITKKEPLKKGDASHQRETTIPLTKAEYDELCELPGKRVEKTRFYYQENIEMVTKPCFVANTQKSKRGEDGRGRRIWEYTPTRTDEAAAGFLRVQQNKGFCKHLKVRYEIDAFRGDLEGLVLVDVEFSSLKEKSAFVAPMWCLAEVTQEKFLAGGIVCGKKYSDIEVELQRFNYKRLEVK